MKCRYCDRVATHEVSDDEIATFIPTCSDGECIEKAETRLEQVKASRDAR